MFNKNVIQDSECRLKTMKHKHETGIRRDPKSMIFLVFIVLGIILLLSSNTIAQVTLSAIEIPESIDENNDIEISIMAETDLDNSILSYKILKNNVLVSTDPVYDEYYDFNSSGEYVYSIIVEDSESSVAENKTLIVNDVPYELSIDSPISRTYYSRDVHIEVSANQNESSCNYVLNEQSGSLMQQDEEGIYFAKDITLNADGDYRLDVSCSNRFSSKTSSVDFQIDTDPILVLAKSYFIDNDYKITLNVETSIKAGCKYDINDVSYDSMSNNFQNTNSFTHSTLISGPSDGTNNYYVRCKAINGNVMQESALISFSIIRKPTASITLSKESPLKAGTYTVKVKTSKNLQSISLQYSFNTDTSLKTVFLTGSDDEWNGYLIIDQDTPNRIGSFKFSGTDYSGVVGTKITEGELFLVDTTKPEAVGSVQAELKSNYIKLRWHYEGEEADSFNIYRSEEPGVDYVDYYRTTKFNADEESHTRDILDSDLDSGSVYYYRIAAVDEAGNEGELSDEVSVEMSGKYSEGNAVPDTTRNLDSSLIKKVNEYIDSVNKMVLDVQSKKEDMNAINDPAKLKIISELKLMENFDTALGSLENIKSEAENLKSQDITSSELDVRLNKLRLDAIKAGSSVPENIELVDSGNFEQFLQESDLNEGIRYILDNINITKKSLDNYTLINQKLQDQISVKTEMFSFKIQYMNKDEFEKYTYIEKSIVSSSDLSNVVVIEIIPKEAEKKASNIIFSNQPAIIKDDPVVKWSFDNIKATEISYRIKDIVDINYIKNSKTIVLFKPDFKLSDAISEKSGHITSYALFGNFKLKNLSFVQWFIIIGIGLIIALGFYYFIVLDGIGIMKNSSLKKKKECLKKGYMEIIDSNRRIFPTKNADNNVIMPVIKNPQTNYAEQKTEINSQAKQPVQDTAKLDPKFLSQRELLKKIQYCNSIINSFKYEEARILYYELISKLEIIDDKDMKNEAKRMLQHIYMKLDSYRHIHNARRHVYMKNKKEAKKSLSIINDLYSKLAYTIGFIDLAIKDEEIRFLQYIADAKSQFEEYSD